MLWLTVLGPAGRGAQPALQLDTAQQHIQNGNAAYSRKDYKLAIKEFKKAQSLDRTLAETYLMLAWTFRAQRKDEDAFKNVEEAIKRQPNYPDAHCLMARLYFERNDIRNSKRELDVAINQGAANANVHILQADLELINRNYQGAVREYAEGIRLADSRDLGLPVLQDRIEALKNYIDFKSEPQDPTVKLPVPQNRPRPNYTEQARSRKIQGSVKEMALIDERGRIRYILVVSRLGYGLDEEAVAATRVLKFSPATRDGKPILYWVHLEVEFNLR